VARGWEKVHNEEAEMGCICNTIMENMNASRLLVEKPEGKRSLGRQRRRSVDNNALYLGETLWGGMDIFNLAEDSKH
jgi:hypothetical protein